MLLQEFEQLILLEVEFRRSIGAARVGISRRLSPALDGGSDAAQIGAWPHDARKARGPRRFVLQ
jgi:hypothetical protein